MFKFYTYQDENDINFQWRMRVTVQMTDRNGESCFAQINRPQGPVDTEYTGEDTWEFHVPHGAMDRPQVSAYIIQYGVLQDGVFVPVVEKFYRAEELQELIKNPRCRVEFSVMRHYYNYRQDGEVLTSQPN